MPLLYELIWVQNKFTELFGVRLNTRRSNIRKFSDFNFWWKVVKMFQSNRFVIVIKSKIELFRKKSPRQKWMLFRDGVGAMLSFCGVNFLDPKFRLTFYSFVPGGLAIVYFASMFYTICHYWDKPIKGLETTCPIAMLAEVNATEFLIVDKEYTKLQFQYIFQCLLVYFIVVSPTPMKKMRSLVFFGGDYVYEIAHPGQSAKYKLMCERCVIKLWLSAFKTFLLVLLGAFSFASMTVYSYLFRNARPLFIPVILPFVNVNTTAGYYTNIAYQIVFSTLGLTGVFVIEFMTCILKNNVWIGSESIKVSTEYLAAGMANNSKFTYEAKMRLRNVLMKIKDFDDFIIKFRDLNYWKFFLQPTLATYAVSASLFIYFYVSAERFIYFQLMLPTLHFLAHSE